MALRFCRSRRKGSALNNLAGALPTASGERTLLFAREVKMEIAAEPKQAAAGQWIAPKMVNTPGHARFLHLRGIHSTMSIPTYIAKQIADFLAPPKGR